MKILIDTCVLYPTVMREMVLGAASSGAFVPVWSSRILEEWRRAAAKLGPEGPLQASAEIAVLQQKFATAEVNVPAGLEARLWLPDPNDIHILAAAVASSVDAIMTLNSKDFPRGILAEEGLNRVNPDSYLLQVWRESPDLITEVGDEVLSRAKQLSGKDWQIRPLLKKARLPRLAKALSQEGN